MKSKTNIVILILLILSVLILIFSGIFKKAEAPDIPGLKSTSPLGENSSPVAFKTLKDNIENSKVTITVTKPIITGLSNKAVNDAVNNEIEKIYSNAQNSFIDDVKDTKLIDEDHKNQMIIQSSGPVSTTDKTFYVEIMVFSNYSGSAHPITNLFVLNFVKETGQLIRFEDVFKRDSSSSLDKPTFKKAMSLLADFAKPKVLESIKKGTRGDIDSASDDTVLNPEDSFFAEGLEPRLENFSVFYILANSIKWTFGQYQVAPYVFGQISIEIPKSDLSASLSDKNYLK